MPKPMLKCSKKMQRSMLTVMLIGTFLLTACGGRSSCPPPLNISEHNIDVLIDTADKDPEFEEFVQDLGRLQEKLRNRQ